MKKTLAIITFLICSGCFATYLNGQDYGWTKLWAIPAEGNQLTTDNLGNSYIIQGDMIKKYRDDGSLYRIYSNKRLGNISSTDAMNPLKIILFYKDFSRIVFLDNTVTENGNALQLEDRDLELASLACASFDNGIWVYDPVRFLLVRFNQQLQETVSITNLNQILGYAPDPNYMTEYESILYINDPSRGILRFDIFGTYLSTIPIVDLEKFQVFDKQLFYSKGEGDLIAYGLTTLQKDTLRLPVDKYKNARWWKDRIYILTGDSLKTYEYGIRK
ncbi:MAG: hypothetical protein WED33_04800 [Bacteroidia bacterium]